MPRLAQAQPMPDEQHNKQLWSLQPTQEGQKSSKLKHGFPKNNNKRVSCQHTIVGHQQPTASNYRPSCTFAHPAHGTRCCVHLELWGWELTGGKPVHLRTGKSTHDIIKEQVNLKIGCASPIRTKEMNGGCAPPICNHPKNIPPSRNALQLTMTMTLQLMIVSDERQHCKTTIVAIVFLQCFSFVSHCNLYDKFQCHHIWYSCEPILDWKVLDSMHTRQP
jgi:hypothetical protein